MSKGDPKEQIEQILGVPEVDCAVDAVGFEARATASEASTEPRDRAELADGGHARRRCASGSPGSTSLVIRVPPTTQPKRDPCRSDGPGMGQVARLHHRPCPVMSYNRQLMMAILHDRVSIAKNVNATPIPLDQAPRGY